MKTPTITTKLDKNLDQKVFINALNRYPDIVHNTFPQIDTEQDVKDAVRYVYSGTDETEKLYAVENALPHDHSLAKIMMIISEALDYSWDGIDEVTIIPATSPIFPRYIDSNSFLVPYYWPMNWILKNCAHELTHLLYFKKLSDLLEHKIDTEFPSNDWLLSEIVAPIVVNDQKIQAIVNAEDVFYSPKDNIISSRKRKGIEKLFVEEKNIIKFREKALKEIGQE